MNLRKYYTNIQNNFDKNKFILTVMDQCRVNYPTVRSWIAKDTAKYKRIPKPIYRGILSKITGIDEENLF